MTKAQVEHELELMVEARDLYGQIIPGEKCICAAIDFRNWPDNLQMACGYCREITLIMAALAARERAVWLEAAKHIAGAGPIKAGNVFSAQRDMCANIAEWCREQAQKEQP